MEEIANLPPASFLPNAKSTGSQTLLSPAMSRDGKHDESNREKLEECADPGTKGLSPSASENTKPLNFDGLNPHHPNNLKSPLIRRNLVVN